MHDFVDGGWGVAKVKFAKMVSIILHAILFVRP